MYVSGIDVGGTFTDLVLLDRETEELLVEKVPTTTGDQSIGVLDGLDGLDVSPGDLSMFVHGTTAATNAVIERGGAASGFIGTAGFEDVLQLGYRDRPNLWGLEGEHVPLVPRKHCYGVDERTGPDGTIREPVAVDQVRRAARELSDAGVEAVAVSFLHSYANPENERRAVRAIEEVWPNEHVVRASAILPEMRDFDRASTSVLTAYTQPVITSYLTRMETMLEDGGFDREVQLMQSNGGMASATVSKTRSANTILSGPAAGATAAAYVAARSGYKDVISCDMGGTSFDVALLPGGDPIMTQETELDYKVPIRLPMTDITTIGAGGGSIAQVDDGGILHTGPESAGAEPGPVCYGQGGQAVTITDANLILGRINPDRPIGGELDLDVERARDVLECDVAGELGLSTPDAAEAVIEVSVQKMAGKIRELSINQGYDPRSFTLVAFGGAGPLHAGELIDRSDANRAIVPPYPGVLSALGCVLADVKYDTVQTINRTIESMDKERFADVVARLKRQGRDLLARSADRASIQSVHIEYQSAMKYEGQTHSVTVPFDDPEPTKAHLRERFLEHYLDRYAEPVDQPILVDNVKITVVGVTRDFELDRFRTGAEETLSTALVEERDVYFGGEWHECAIYDREAVPHETTVEGPAILEQPDTTTVVKPGQTCRIDAFGNAILGAAEVNPDD